MINKLYKYKPLPKILIVDDDPKIIHILGSFLGKDFKRQVATSGKSALKILKNTTALPDLILLDLVMPEINGYEVFEQIQEDKNLNKIPIVFMSSLLDMGNIERAFELGGTDYIIKPFDSKEVKARIMTHINKYHEKKALEEKNLILNQLVEKKVKEISDSQMATIFALAKLTESRDDDTGKHLEGVQSFSKLLLIKMQMTEDYGDLLDLEYIETVEKASVLHDIGKIGIEDSILLKSGKLSEDQFNKMKEHTLIGSRTLREVYEKYPENQFIRIGIEIAHFHHEKWDGSGYPEGLVGEDIPLSARVVALADIYDALRSERVYKEKFSHEKACHIIEGLSGKHLDPKIVRVFLEYEREFESMYDGIKD